MTKMEGPYAARPVPYRDVARDVTMITCMTRAWQKKCDDVRVNAENGNYGAMADRTRLSEYFYTLDHESKQRYIQKIAHFNGEDPYWLKKDAFSQLVDDLPEIQVSAT